MRLTMKERKKVTGKLTGSYKLAGKKMKGQILDNFVTVTGYDRCYASWLLRNHGKRIRVNGRLIIIGVYCTQ